MTLRWRPARRGERAARRRCCADFRAGWRLVFDDPALRALVLLGWGAAVFLIAPEAVALAYARDDGAGPAVGAALMASLPAGAALGACAGRPAGPDAAGALDRPARRGRLPAAAGHQPGAAVGGGAGAVVPEPASARASWCR